MRDDGKRDMGPQSWCHFVGKGEGNRHSLWLLWESQITKRTVLSSEKETEGVGERPRRMSS